MTIQLEETETKGAAFYELNGARLAEMTFSKAGAQLIIIDHTEVDVSLQGQGVGKKMLVEIVHMARKQGKIILPLCPYAKSQFDKDESIADVLR